MEKSYFKVSVTLVHEYYVLATDAAEAGRIALQQGDESDFDYLDAEVKSVDEVEPIEIASNERVLSE